MTARPRVLICDDQAVVREGLETILKGASEVEVVGTAADGEAALQQTERWAPDVVLMDLKMPVMNGIRATREIRQRFPGVRVLVLTTYDADEWVYDAIRAGACGYLLKDTPSERLVEAILGTAAGRTHIDPTVAGKLFEQVARGSPPPQSALIAELSEREREVLGLLAEGLCNSAIAKRLFLSEGTVRNYLTVIYEKLGVSDRTQAAVLAARDGLGRGT
jgi:two-component system, NarL family, response regulator LiaR